ncbi:ATP-binding protein [Halobaculum sp. D14]|uniref:ATP-binding protein n=1 Tax=Halobaculum sp. D14 TaxID=3421642 RepID=UPI003EB7EF5A
MSRTGLPTTRLLVPLLGACILLLAAGHVAVDGDVLAYELVEASILLVFAAAVFYVGYRVDAGGFGRPSVWRILAASLGAGAVIGGLSGVYLLGRLLTGEPISEGWFVLMIGWSLGVSGGAVVGFVLEELRREQEAQALMTKRLAILQRVLRHNIRNEVTILSGIGNDAAESTDDPELAERLETMTDHVDRVYQLSEKSQLLSDLWKTTEVLPVDLAAVTRQEVGRFRDAHPDVVVTTSLPEEALVQSHESGYVAIREALQNAAEHNATEGLNVSVSIEEAGDETLLHVVDDGSSIPEAELDVLAQSEELPLQHLTGLGLWVIYWVLELSGGDVEFENRDPSGVRVTMRFEQA